MTRPPEPEPTPDCWDCHHTVPSHGEQYPEHERGCHVTGCPCRRWFTIVRPVETVTRYHIAQKGWEESNRAWSFAEGLLADIDALPDNPPAVVAILQRYRDEYGPKGPGTKRLAHIQRALDSAVGRR